MRASLAGDEQQRERETNWYQDGVNSSFSHTATYSYDGVNQLTNAVASGSATYNLIYKVGPASAHGPSTAGSLIASDTETFAIPYRPSEDDTHCTGSEAGAWYDTQVNPPTCFHGLFTSVQFNFGHVTLPNSVIYGIAYNTSDWGAAPDGGRHRMPHRYRLLRCSRGRR